MARMVERVLLITGASSGIGAATARRMARPAMGMILHARGGVGGEKRPALEQVAETAREAGADVDTAISDLGEDSARALVTAALDRFGRLDQIVSNAGHALTTPLGELSRAEFDHSMAVIAGAFVDLLNAARDPLAASGAGRVVAVSSFVVGHAPGGRIFPATAAAKGAVEALARTFAAQMAASGVTVNCVAPGFTRKESQGHSALPDAAWREAAEMTPNGRLAEPEDIAAAIAFFLSEEARHITGQTLHVDGGLMLN